MFYFRHVNRAEYPQKHILICEDDLSCQKRILDHLSQLFDPQGVVQISVVPGSLMAASIIMQCKVDLIILDHDMPQGNGTDFLNWMKTCGKHIPIITFSGIPQNNTHMGTLGATYPFWNKEDIIGGQADDLIKGLMNTKSSIAEIYANTLCRNFMSHRWWAHPQILVGGSIIDADDYEHLKKEYNIQSVINVESEHMDWGKNIANLLECRVNDDGSPFPNEYVINAVKFAKKSLERGNIYVHCQMGSSRSPAFAYAILRHCFSMSSEDALKQISDNRPDDKNYGHHPFQKNYIATVEDALTKTNTGVAEWYDNFIGTTKDKPIHLPRYWVLPNIMVSGDINDESDLEHLRKQFNVEAVINADHRTGSIIKNSDTYLHCPVEDNGVPFPKEKVLQIIQFAALHRTKNLYIHCHLGFSRSPHFAYAILRGVYQMKPQQALETIRKALPTSNHHWGFSNHTASYIKSIEDALE